MFPKNLTTIKLKDTLNFLIWFTLKTSLSILSSNEFRLLRYETSTFNFIFNLCGEIWGEMFRPFVETSWDMCKTDIKTFNETPKII